MGKLRFWCCQNAKTILTIKITVRIKDDQEKSPKLFGKQSIPGGQRGILIEARLPLE
jgi:hypothetical protein